MMLNPRSLRWLLVAVGMTVAPTVLALRAQASDHADTAENFKRIGADMTDVFIFPSPQNPDNVVIVMDVHGLIPTGMGGTVSFDPNVLYQMKMDVTGDFVEDLVIQAKFFGTGRNQTLRVAGPMKPSTTGTSAFYSIHDPVGGRINQPFTTSTGMMVFAGVREEPFFFDLNQFYMILPDRKTPLSGRQIDFPSIMAADTPQALSFRPPGQAMDYFNGLNVLSIIVELPRAALGGGMVRLWETTSVFVGLTNNGLKFVQQDRLARPAINEALATVTNRRHEVNNKDNPTDDAGQLKNDIEAFLTFPAGRSTAIKTVIESVLIPDVMMADLSQAGPAAYLGVETGGATGGKFGGRALTDDVIDIDLGVVFGNVIPSLMLAPDDNKEIPTLTTDNVGPGDKHFMQTFPYLGEPQ